jgi:hypothetical protein
MVDASLASTGHSYSWNIIAESPVARTLFFLFHVGG